MPSRRTSMGKRFSFLILFIAMFFGVLFYPFSDKAGLVATVHGQAVHDDVALSDEENDRGADVDSMPSLDEIIANVDAALASIDSVELIVELQQFSPSDGSVTYGKGQLSARLPDLFRFDWLQPDMMAGSILLVDKQKNEAHQYNPIREEIIVQRWDTLAAQQNLTPEIDQWLSLPDPDDYLLQVKGIEVIDNNTGYVVSARPHEDPPHVYEFLINSETWLVSHFRQYDEDGRLALRGSLTNVRINGDIVASKISAMPPFARIRYR